MLWVSAAIFFIERWRQDSNFMPLICAILCLWLAQQSYEILILTGKRWRKRQNG